MTKKSPKQRANFYMYQYWALRECARFRAGGHEGAEYEHHAFPRGWIEDYGADAIAFDVWSEDPTWYEQDMGYRPHAPLTRQRRAEAREQGFRFHIDGTVSHDEAPHDRFDGKTL